jgi:hypothetical protein
LTLNAGILTAPARLQRREGSAHNPVEIEPYCPQLPRAAARGEAAGGANPSAEVAANAGQVQFYLSLPAHNEIEFDWVMLRFPTLLHFACQSHELPLTA